MGLFAEFDVVEDFGYLAATEQFNVIPDYGPGNDVFVDTFMSVAQRLVPVDTGYLRSTLKAECSDTYCCAEADCEYAEYPEYGTWCQAAQPYFTPALEAAIAAAAPLWDEAQEWAEEEELQLQEELQEQEEQQFQAGGFGSFMQFIAILIVVAVITIFQELFRIDERETNSSHGISGIGRGFPFIPDVIIT